ncbi:MAG: 1-deoxy-D-xylulose-5-phosphate synthase, partial [Gammaproteobacteria bacterium]|nr:1-deoxy-D-xylulose-5-phosphate synthase [Gammaproteobacteria bacterium]
AVRYPRGSAISVNKDDAADSDKQRKAELKALPFGQAEQVRQGNKVALLVFGTLLATAREVAEEIDASVYSMRFVKPLDTDTIKKAWEQHELLVTIEENAIAGGAGSAVSEYLNQQNLPGKLLQIGFPDKFISHGQPGELLAEWNLDKSGILNTVQRRVKELLI